MRTSNAFSLPSCTDHIWLPVIESDSRPPNADSASMPQEDQDMSDGDEAQAIDHGTGHSNKIGKVVTIQDTAYVTSVLPIAIPSISH